MEFLRSILQATIPCGMIIGGMRFSKEWISLPILLPPRKWIESPTFSRSQSRMNVFPSKLAVGPVR